MQSAIYCYVSVKSSSTSRQHSTTLKLLRYGSSFETSPAIRINIPQTNESSQYTIMSEETKKSVHNERFYNALFQQSDEKEDRKTATAEWTTLGSDQSSCDLREGGLRQDLVEHYSIDERELPSPTNECICTHPIVKNKIIYNMRNKNILVVGTCCIRKFIGFDKKKQCDRCGESVSTRSKTVRLHCPQCKAEIERESEAEINRAIESFRTSIGDLISSPKRFDIPTLRECYNKIRFLKGDYKIGFGKYRDMKMRDFRDDSYKRWFNNWTDYGDKTKTLFYFYINYVRVSGIQF